MKQRKKQWNFVGLLLIAVLLLSCIYTPLCVRTQAEELMAAVDFQYVLDGDTGAVQDEQDESGQDATGEGTDAQDVSGQDATGEGTDEQDVSGQDATGKGTDEPVIGAYTNGYDNRMYLSLRDLAQALTGTPREFDFYRDYEADSYVIRMGHAYEAPEPETYYEEGPDPENGQYYDEDGNLRDDQDEIVWENLPVEVTRPEYEYLELYRNPLMIGEEPVEYFTCQLSLMEDLYMNVIDAQLMLNMTITKDGDNVLHLQTEDGFTADLKEFEEDGYFDLFNGVILGDATTGEVLYGRKEDNMDAIASTSKLMTYMVVARYMELGKIHMDDVVTLSWNVANLSQSGYGTLYMEAGQEVTVHDLLACLLLPSSNESAVALAEHVAGSEEAFVELMNQMAQLLGLSSARFYNASGLPEYSDSLIASVVQNHMSAKDLFRLASAVLRKYPEITEFTSQTSMYLETFDFTVWNSNQLLYNLDECIGLKTGTTDEAGCCLVAAAKMQQADGEHILVAIVLGANSNLDRFQVPHLLLRWGLNQKMKSSEVVY